MQESHLTETMEGSHVVLTLSSPAIASHGGDIPGGPVVKNPAANAGDTGLISDPGRAQAAGQLNLCAAATEPRVRALQQEKLLQ